MVGPLPGASPSKDPRASVVALAQSGGVPTVSTSLWMPPVHGHALRWLVPDRSTLRVALACKRCDFRGMPHFFLPAGRAVVRAPMLLFVSLFCCDFGTLSLRGGW